MPPEMKVRKRQNAHFFGCRRIIDEREPKKDSKATGYYVVLPAKFKPKKFLAAKRRVREKFGSAAEPDQRGVSRAEGSALMGLWLGGRPSTLWWLPDAQWAFSIS